MSKKDKIFRSIYDGLENVVSGLGTAKDKRTTTEFTENDIDDATLEIMYSHDWLTGKVVDCPAEDMTRKWRELNSGELSPEDMDLIKNEEKRVDVKSNVQEAIKLARLYGGSIIYMNLDESLGKDSDPLEYEKVKQESLISLLPLDKTQIDVKEITEELKDPNYRKPEFYEVKGSSVKIHHSRILRFDGYFSPWNVRKSNQYWHNSIVKRVYESIKNSQSVANSVNSIVYEASVDIVKIPDLFAKMAQKGGEEKLINRFKLADLMKSFNNMLILDSKEDYQKVATSFAGLPDLMIKFLNIAAGASDIPATRLLGQSAQGLNATGEGDLKNYYDMISSQQEKELGPQLEKLDNVLVPSAIGSMPEDWNFKFNPLSQLTELEKADKENKDSQRDKIYIETGSLPLSVIVKQLQRRGTYGDISNELIEALEAIEGETGSTSEE